MTASQQPDAEHAPLTSPAAAGSGSTGHDKAVELVARALMQPRMSTNMSGDKQCYDAVAVLAALRAALAAGDAGVAEALGLMVDLDDLTARWRRFVTDWREVSGE